MPDPRDESRGYHQSIAPRCADSRLPQGDSALQCPPAVAENQPTIKNRMTSELSNFAARLREAILSEGRVTRVPDLKGKNGGSYNSPLREDATFNALALELFALQFKHNSAYRTICEAQKRTPEVVEHWTRIPAVPAAAFKELDLTCLAPFERTAVFHSSGTTEQKPSRHFHNAESLKLYEASLLAWFRPHLLADKLKLELQPSAAPVGVQASACGCVDEDFELVILTPPPAQAPHSSLVHMFETVRQKLSVEDSAFQTMTSESFLMGAGARFGVPPSGGRVNAELQTEVTCPSAAFWGTIGVGDCWTLDFAAVVDALSSHASSPVPRALFLLGTAFSFVHLLDFLEEQNLSFRLPPGSRVMETGGYKNRSRSMPKAELHALITERLGIPQSHIVREYGMSELSSQAYDGAIQANDLNLPHPGPLPKERGNCRQSVGEFIGFGNSKERTLLFPLPEGEGQGEGKRVAKTHYFHFPPWARVQIISPETGREVADGETGLIRVFDLANVFSVMAIQTEDLGVRHDDGFELLGRAQFAEPRGCSLMMDEPLSPPSGERVAEGRVRG